MDQILNKEQRDFFSAMVANPERVGVAHVQQLKTLVDLYPQSGILRGFLARASQTNEQGNFQQRLKSAAVYAPDRSVLYNLINYPEKLIRTREYKGGLSGMIGVEPKVEPTVEETLNSYHEEEYDQSAVNHDEDNFEEHNDEHYFHESEPAEVVSEPYEFNQPEETIAETPFFQPELDVTTKPVVQEAEQAPMFDYKPQTEDVFEAETLQQSEEELATQQYQSPPQTTQENTFAEPLAVVEQPVNIYPEPVAFQQGEEIIAEPSLLNYQQPEQVAPIYEQPIVFAQPYTYTEPQEQPVIDDRQAEEQQKPVDDHQRPEDNPQHYDYQEPETPYVEETPVYYQEAVLQTATNYYQEPEVIQYWEETNVYDPYEQYPNTVHNQEVEYRFHEAEVEPKQVQYFTEPSNLALSPEAAIDEEVYDEITGIDDIYFVPELGTEKIEEFTVTEPESLVQEKYTSYQEIKREEPKPVKVVPVFEIENEEPKPKPYSSIIDKAIKKPTVAEDDDDSRVSKYNDDKMPYSFMWWLDKTRKEHADSHQPYIPAKPVEQEVAAAPPVGPIVQDELQQQYYANIFNLSSIEELDKLTVKGITKEKESQIIERFIEEAPQIKQSSEKIDNENKAKKSAEDHNEIISETLAKVYTDQMLYHKAISTYQKLMLKNPEKSSYFVAQIELLEKKIN